MPLVARQYKKKQYKKTFKKKAPVKKRGVYFDARIGKNVPFVGGSSFRLGTRSVKSIVRREMNRQEEIKQISTNVVTSFTHNTLSTIAPLQLVAKGTEQWNRNDDQCFIRHVKVRLTVNNYSTLSHTDYRFMVVWTEKQHAATTWTSGVGSTDVFIGSPYLTSAMINNKAEAEIAFDKSISISTYWNGQVKSKVLDFDIPVMRKVQYFQQFIKDKDLYIVAVATTPGGTTGTTVVGSMNTDIMVTFKDD